MAIKKDTKFTFRTTKTFKHGLFKLSDITHLSSATLIELSISMLAVKYKDKINIDKRMSNYFQLKEYELERSIDYYISNQNMSRDFFGDRIKTILIKYVIKGKSKTQIIRQLELFKNEAKGYIKPKSLVLEINEYIKQVNNGEFEKIKEHLKEYSNREVDDKYFITDAKNKNDK